MLIIGHRGASGYEPENTLRSFEKAIELGVDAIELDVYKCRSGQIVVMHDETVDRTTNGTGKVKDLSWDELKKLCTGKGEHIPLLSQVLDLVDQRVVINIEIKDLDVVKDLAETIDNYINFKKWNSDKFIVSSFIFEAIQKFKNCCLQIRTGAIFDECTQDVVKESLKYKADLIVVDYNSVSAKLIQHAHAVGLKIFVYTVNLKQDIERMKSLNVDGVITDYSDIKIV